MAIKKTTTKKAVKKVAAKKAPAKKASPAKKAAPASKTPVKKAAPVKKATPVKKAAPAKKAVTAKKAQSQKTVTTSIIAKVDVGFGNSLFIRGEGAGLSWEKGTVLENLSPYEWQFSTTAANEPVTFKFLINDEAWADGDNLTVAPGECSVNAPVFNW